MRNRRYLTITPFMPSLIGGIVGFIFGYFLLTTFPYSVIRPINLDREAPVCSPSLGKADFKKGNKSNFNDAIENLQKRKRQLITALYNETRLLCWVMTEPKNKDRRAAVMDTWGKRCHLTLFMVGAKEMLAIEAKSSKDTPSTPPQSRLQIAPNAYLVYLDMEKDTYENLWSKTRSAFVYIQENFPDAYDWVLKVDDDSFVIVENLRLFLRDKKPRDPFYYGCQYHGYHSGGPGYILSQIHVEKFVQQLKGDGKQKDEVCSERTPNTAPEDQMMGQCLSKLGIKPGDTRDQYGRFRFSPFGPEETMHHEKLPPQFKWFWGFSAHKLAKGFECCSDSFISFHYISPTMMRMMEYLTYYAHPFSSRQIWNYNATY